MRRLARDHSFHDVIAPVRRRLESVPAGVRQLLLGDLSSTTDWSSALRGVKTVVHCAARVHMMSDDAQYSLEAYRDVNVLATINLARQAARAGVRRFIFISSIKVNGEATKPGQLFKADDVPAPVDPYGMSKLEAEQGLRKLETQTSMEVVIVRPPLVYGFGVKANFAAMIRLVSRGIPLPFGAIYNSRSMVALENLVDLLIICLRHPGASGQTFLVSDGEDLSTTELFRRTADALEKKLFLLAVPVCVLKWGATLLGKRAVAQRLCGSLQVDIEKTRELLSWSPTVSVNEGLKQAVKGARK